MTILCRTSAQRFRKPTSKPDGTVGTGTQTSYVVALYTGMAPTSLEPLLVDKLVKDIETRNWHLSTGFLGTPFLLFTLADHGRSDVAYRLLLNDTYPSWGYMLSKGATTWWERWNGDSGDPSMNSYNHYAFRLGHCMGLPLCGRHRYHARFARFQGDCDSSASRPAHALGASRV